MFFVKYIITLYGNLNILSLNIIKFDTVIIQSLLFRFFYFTVVQFIHINISFIFINIASFIHWFIVLFRFIG